MFGIEEDAPRTGVESEAMERLLSHIQARVGELRLRIFIKGLQIRGGGVASR